MTVDLSALYWNLFLLLCRSFLASVFMVIHTSYNFNFYCIPTLTIFVFLLWIWHFFWNIFVVVFIFRFLCFFLLFLQRWFFNLYFDDSVSCGSLASYFLRLYFYVASCFSFLRSFSVVIFFYSSGTDCLLFRLNALLGQLTHAILYSPRWEKHFVLNTGITRKYIN